MDQDEEVSDARRDTARRLREPHQWVLGEAVQMRVHRYSAILSGESLEIEYVLVPRDSLTWLSGAIENLGWTAPSPTGLSERIAYVRYPVPGLNGVSSGAWLRCIDLYTLDEVP